MKSKETGGSMAEDFRTGSNVGYSGHKLSPKSQEIINKTTGMTVDHISHQLILDDEISRVRCVTGGDLAFSKKQKLWIIGRGNPLIARRKIRTMKDVNRKLERF